MSEEFARRARDLTAPNQAIDAANRARAGRFAEDIASRRVSERAPQPPPAKVEVPYPSVFTERATLVERDNQDEFLEFHWNPSSYKISKSAGWGEKRSGTATPTLEWQGPGLTQVSFDLLLNDVWQHEDRPNRKTTEESLEWLFDRLRNRTIASAGRATPAPPRRVSWLNVRNLSATAEPPVMVLFGLARPFECRLASVNINTVFQGRSPQRTTVNPNDTSIGALRTLESRSSPASVITRANVSITLKEYFKAPQVENQKKQK